MYASYSPRDLFAELDRLQRHMQRALDLSPSIRGFARDGFPALNVGGTPQTLEIYAFAPGVDASTLEVGLERGLLTIAGERQTELPDEQSKSAVHIHERFRGRFSRTLSLPDDADPEQVSARLRDGILHITVQRRASAQPRRITVQ
ncbi:Hsp20/alpha crystallin family protein [Xenophilus sp. Marseille-Q4582]|uniref:Hsp20/alpha crystallin family protein n=1 Tax=Xenophilus sp. Marseille-Q4582 TaxID=2866600 RepID=UPI001CE3C519|nr:Hsp20/alpha crystallin family protein [Xenophilus sp. Marseille-Q4582]